jgi:AcrR family transcriptional regulator
MNDIIDASGVSRGTLYRYFSNKDEVLAAVGEYVCTGFETGIRAAGEHIADPMERFRAVMQFYARYTNENSPDRIFEVEPRFHLEFFRTRFARYKAAVSDALSPVFDHFDVMLGVKVERDGFVEALVRLQLSTLLVPADETWSQLWNQSPDFLENWALKFARQNA